MKAAILYASVHHGNTKKVAEAMAEPLSADLFDLTKQSDVDISGYDLLASLNFGITVQFNFTVNNVIFSINS